MRHGGGCSIRLALYFCLTSGGASAGGGGGGSARKMTSAVHCRLESAGPSWLMATRFAPFSSYV
eukprot:59409-Prymnesium_polylepis.1